GAPPRCNSAPPTNRLHSGTPTPGYPSTLPACSTTIVTSMFQGVAGPSPAFGNPNAPVKVFVWSDFQCPNCARVVEPLKYLARKFPDDVLVVFRHNPLPTHKKASYAYISTY